MIKIKKVILNKLYYLWLKVRNCKVLGAGEIYKKVNEAKKKKKSEVCHILGSGASLNLSLKEIQNSDFVMGCNYSGLSIVEHDFYLLEFSGPSYQNVSEDHFSIAYNIVKKNTDLIFFKNVWENKNKLSSIITKFKMFNFPIVEDRLLIVEEKEQLEPSIREAICGKSDSIPQLSSTVVTLLFIAIRCGFKKIVIHGVDFGGEYFYQSSNFDSINLNKLSTLNLFNPDKNEGLYPLVSINKQHDTNKSFINFEMVLCEIHKQAKSLGVDISAGYKSSKLEGLFNQNK
ncbi:MAG: hypothetical protein ACI8RP_000566 [Urechidicola sp.]|jgi:hypothetical protein